jgi:DNA modification methylase
MYYYYFKLFNNIKSVHESEELARLELESLFGEVEPIYNFADKLKEEPLSKFTSPSTRIQDFVIHELPYGKIQGYFGISDEEKNFGRLVKRLAYTREIYLIVPSNKSLEVLIKEIFSDVAIGRNCHYYEVDNFILFRLITHQYFIEKSEYISKLSRNEKEVERNVETLFSHLVKDIYRIPASSTLSVGKRLQDYFAIREETSLYLTHYFHPYKGKFHPKMVRAVLNYIYPYDEGVILDNFAGSGTLLVEATLMGLDSVGVEINPLSVLMSNVKCNSFSLDLGRMKAEISSYFEKASYKLSDYSSIKRGQLSFSLKDGFDFDAISHKSINLSTKLKNHLRDKNEIIPQVLICKGLLNEARNKEAKDFLLLALSGAISDVARRTSEHFLDVFRDRVNNLYLRLFLFNRMNEVLKIHPGCSKTYVGDTRDMKNLVNSSAIDGIVNSPPYSVALDYIKNDFPQLVLLELTDSLEKLEINMMGSPKVNYDKRVLFKKIEEETPPLAISKTADKVVKYLLSSDRQQAGLRSFKFFIDMSESLKEMYRVMKKSTKCAIVIGNNHFMVDNQYIEVPNDKVILELAEKIGFVCDKYIGRELQKSSEGNIREESILIFKKE